MKVNKCAFFLLLMTTGCVSTAVDSPRRVTATSFAQPDLVQAPVGSATMVDWTGFVWSEDDPQAVAYNLYYGSISPHEFDQVIPTTNLSAVVSNMVPGTAYHLAVTAVGVDGTESDFSPEYNYVMPTNLEIGFTFNQPATNVMVQSSYDLMNWQASDARQRTNGLWRIAVDGAVPQEFYRGIGQAAPAL